MKSNLNIKQRLFFSTALFSVLFSILIAFGVDEGTSLLGKDNIFAKMIVAFGLTPVKATPQAWAIYSLVFIYTTIFLFGMIAIIIEAKKSEESLWSPFWTGSIIILFLYCLIFSFGMGTLLSLPLDIYFETAMRFVSQVILLSFMFFIFLGVLVTCVYLVVHVFMKKKGERK